MNNTRSSFRSVNWRLYAALLLSALMPTLYTTLRIRFLGALPGDWGFNIASQLTWVNVVYEVLQEGLILPLFFILGRVAGNREELSNRIKTGLILALALYAIVGLAVSLGAHPLLVFMKQKAEIIPASVTYIRIETISIAISIAYRFIGLVFIVLGREKWMYLLLAAQMALSMISDTFLVSSLSFSARLGVNGIAIGNIIVNTMLCLIAWMGLRRLKVVSTSRRALDFSWMSAWAKIGGISGLESLVRNAAFILMVVRLVNQVQEQGNFWVANNFIWGWILLPVLALGELIKRDAGNDPAGCRSRFATYMLITGIICVSWLVSIPAWRPFLKTIMGIADYQVIYQVALVSLPFYLTFAFNNVIDSIFYGLGRTDLMLYQSITVNTVFYGGAFIANRIGLFSPSLMGIAVMFGLGIAFDSIITAFIYWYLHRKGRLYS
jgi:Na+-driven multidrug efflux pump